jgi:hypothetical protein
MTAYNRGYSYETTDDKIGKVRVKLQTSSLFQRAKPILNEINSFSLFAIF